MDCLVKLLFDFIELVSGASHLHHFPGHFVFLFIGDGDKVNSGREKRNINDYKSSTPLRLTATLSVVEGC